MSFTKWKVTRFCEEPIEFTFKKETDHFFTNGRVRESKNSLRHKFFDTEQEALDYMDQREANKVEQKLLDQIRSVAPELLEALELAAETLRRYEGYHRAKQTQESLDKAIANQQLAMRFEAVIAKARGEGV